jgi:hypothetical protein
MNSANSLVIAVALLSVLCYHRRHVRWCRGGRHEMMNCVSILLKLERGLYVQDVLQSRSPAE